MMTQRPVTGSLRSSGTINLLSDGEGVLKQLDFRLASHFQIDADDIEAEGRGAAHFAQEVAGHTGKVALLFLVHSHFRRLNIACGARLDFDKTKHVAVPSDQVQLAAAA